MSNGNSRSIKTRVQRGANVEFLNEKLFKLGFISRISIPRIRENYQESSLVKQKQSQRACGRSAQGDVMLELLHASCCMHQKYYGI